MRLLTVAGWGDDEKQRTDGSLGRGLENLRHEEVVDLEIVGEMATSKDDTAVMDMVMVWRGSRFPDLLIFVFKD